MTDTVPDHAVNSTDGPVEHIANADPWTVKERVWSEPSRPGPFVATSEGLTETKPVDLGDGDDQLADAFDEISGFGPLRFLGREAPDATTCDERS